MSRGSYAKYWVFTENVDPDQLRHALIDEGLPEGITYACGQIEQGNHLHFQGYLELEARQRVSWLKRNFSSTAHFEIRRGTQEEAIEYTRKLDDTTIPMTWNEWGEPTDEKKGKRNDLLDVKAMIDGGENDQEIANSHFGSWIRYHKAFAAYKALSVKKRDPSEPCTVIVHYGCPGAGKSKAAYEYDPTAYRKPVSTKWWDKYSGEKAVVFDDMNGSWFSWSELLTILDRYPAQVEIKGGYVELSANTFIITTNTHPKDWYRNKPWDALLRRITTFFYYSAVGEEPQMMDPPYDCPPPTWVRQPENFIPGYRWN